MGLDTPDSRCWISDSQNPKRKLRHTLELMEVVAPDGIVLVGINTNRPNALAEEAILAGNIPQLNGYTSLRREVRYGENSRVDILLESPNSPPCYVEVKNVHFVRQSGLHEFPDCKSARAVKHLHHLANMVGEGARAVLLFVIQREDGDRFQLARDIDPHIAKAFDDAITHGVEALAIRCQISTEEIVAKDIIPVLDIK